MRALYGCALLVVAVAVIPALGGCSSKGYGRVHYGVHYGGYYGRGPWYGYRRPPIYIGGGPRPELPIEPPGGPEPELPIEPGEPIAVPLPEMGMPDMDFGAMDMGGDF